MIIGKANGCVPQFESRAYIAENATVVGDVKLGEDSSVWYGAVIRGDGGPIRIGKRVAVEDNVTIHDATTLGNDILVGHNAVLHACTVGDRCVLGMHCTILDGAVIGNDCMIGANALITHNTVIPDGSIVMGVPAKVTGRTGESFGKMIANGPKKYVGMAREQLLMVEGTSGPVKE